MSGTPPEGGSPGSNGGLARSPAMHEGFRAEDWVVKRTPVNTPTAAKTPVGVRQEGDKLVVGMVNLEDEEEEEEEDEDETSMHIDSETAFKSGATTPPGGDGADSSLRSSLVQSSLDLPDQKAAVVVQPSRKEEPDLPVPPEPSQNVTAFMPPPAGFCDSPEKTSIRSLPGYQSPVSERSLQPEEMLIAEKLESSPARDEAGAPVEVVRAASVSTYQQQEFEEDFASATMPRQETKKRRRQRGKSPREAEDDEGPAAGMGSSSRSTGDLGEASRSAAGKPRPESTSSVATTATAKSSAGGRSSSSRSRSRSSSKERLLRRLAEADSAPRTTVEEDELEGTISSHINTYCKVVCSSTRILV